LTITARRIAGLALAALIVAADHAIKWWVHHRPNIYAPLDLLPIFRVSYTQNHGVSLGLLTADTLEMRIGLLVVTTVIAIGVLVWIFRERRTIDILALSLVLGGALGNIIDRARVGYVTDYADLHFGEWRPFLIFNLADVAISCGVVIILARSLFWNEKPDPAVKTAPET
jgi:signal peptidase II